MRTRPVATKNKEAQNTNALAHAKSTDAIAEDTPPLPEWMPSGQNKLASICPGQKAYSAPGSGKVASAKTAAPNAIESRASLLLPISTIFLCRLTPELSRAAKRRRLERIVSL